MGQQQTQPNWEAWWWRGEDMGLLCFEGFSSSMKQREAVYDSRSFDWSRKPLASQQQRLNKSKCLKALIMKAALGYKDHLKHHPRMIPPGAAALSVLGSSLFSNTFSHSSGLIWETGWLLNLIKAQLRIKWGEEKQPDSSRVWKVTRSNIHPSVPSFKMKKMLVAHIKMSRCVMNIPEALLHTGSSIQPDFQSGSEPMLLATLRSAASSSLMWNEVGVYHQLNRSLGLCGQRGCSFIWL